eukprot:2587063-Rhodomonas_salina.4
MGSGESRGGTVMSGTYLAGGVRMTSEAARARSVLRPEFCSPPTSTIGTRSCAGTIVPCTWYPHTQRQYRPPCSCIVARYAARLVARYARSVPGLRWQRKAGIPGHGTKRAAICSLVAPRPQSQHESGKKGSGLGVPEGVLVLALAEVAVEGRSGAHPLQLREERVGDRQPRLPPTRSVTTPSAAKVGGEDERQEWGSDLEHAPAHVQVHAQRLLPRTSHVSPTHSRPHDTRGGMERRAYADVVDGEGVEVLVGEEELGERGVVEDGIGLLPLLPQLLLEHPRPLQHLPPQRAHRPLVHQLPRVVRLVLGRQPLHLPPTPTHQRSRSLRTPVRRK